MHGCKLGMLQTRVKFIVLFLVACLYVSNSVRNKRSSPSQSAYEALVCELNENETVQENFHAGVRQQHGVTDSNYNGKHQY